MPSSANVAKSISRSSDLPRQSAGPATIMPLFKVLTMPSTRAIGRPKVVSALATQYEMPHVLYWSASWTCERASRCRLMFAVCAAPRACVHESVMCRPAGIGRASRAAEARLNGTAPRRLLLTEHLRAEPFIILLALMLRRCDAGALQTYRHTPREP